MTHVPDRPTEPVRFRTSANMLARLDRIEAIMRGAGNRRATRSHIIRTAVEAFINNFTPDPLDIQETGGLVALYIIPATWDDHGGTQLTDARVVHEYVGGPKTYLITNGPDDTESPAWWSWVLHPTAVEVWRCPGMEAGA